MYSKFIPTWSAEQNRLASRFRFDPAHSARLRRDRWERSFDGGEDEEDTPSSEEIVASLTARYGDAQKALGVLAAENAKYRRKLRTLKSQNETLSTNAPAEGAVVLSAEEANQWNAIKPLLEENEGKVETIRTKLQEGEEAKGQIAKQNRQTEIASYATLAGFGAPTVLSDLVDNKGIHVEKRVVTVDGNQVEQVVARKASDPNGQLVPLTDYIQTNHSEYLPALQAKSGGGTPTGGAPILIPPMGANGGSGASNPAAEFIKKQNEAAAARTNPLRARATATS